MCAWVCWWCLPLPLSLSPFVCVLAQKKIYLIFYFNFGRFACVLGCEAVSLCVCVLFVLFHFCIFVVVVVVVVVDDVVASFSLRTRSTFTVVLCLRVSFFFWCHIFHLVEQHPANWMWKYVSASYGTIFNCLFARHRSLGCRLPLPLPFRSCSWRCRCCCYCCCVLYILPGWRLYNLLLSICFYARSSCTETEHTITSCRQAQNGAHKRTRKRERKVEKKIKRLHVCVCAHTHTAHTLTETRATKTMSPTTMSMTRKTESKKTIENEIAPRNSSLWQ